MRIMFLSGFYQLLQVDSCLKAETEILLPFISMVFVYIGYYPWWDTCSTPKLAPKVTEYKRMVHGQVNRTVADTSAGKWTSTYKKM